MNARNFVKTKDGRNAGNRYGSCGVLAIAAIKGMRYEDATAWTIKNNMVDKVKHGEVNGMDILKGGGFSTFKKLGAKEVTQFLRGDGHHGPVTEMPEGILKNHVTKLGVTKVHRGKIKIETFAKLNPTGRHMLVTRNHAVAIIHGEIYHNGAGSAYCRNQIVDFSIQF